ncbi:hypothetical protein OWV82_011997 [Melia azedarach]|uniref:Uncharacterized protein n=1 Tax=Melia azedarach TaxID=155640 RepID=A0ACC1Y008_MELAZ|nr:hypothetical protein OWV82_011997 [Melia azedarach]
MPIHGLCQVDPKTVMGRLSLRIVLLKPILGEGKKRRRPDISMKGPSSSSLHVVDFNAANWSRYEHFVPIVKSMEHSAIS